MKRLTNIFCIALLGTLAACNDASTGSESTKSDTTANTSAGADETPMLKDTAALNQAMYAASMPGEVHNMIAKDNGVWEAEMTFWQTPDAQPMKMTGTATNKTIWDNRYQQSNFRCEMAPGMVFEGVSTLGYDNVKKAFVNTWIDNMATGIMYMEGKYDSANKTVNLAGKSTDYRTGKDVSMRQTFRWVDDNTQHLEMYATYPGGKEFKNMEITYKRKK
ncbi:MAG TPA: DUF1579 domain-containing protein [Chitinophagaceae bacterium]|nr:DUF1579 domain-containing protein [Chitinophagaceae bacterium]